jgi:hypothetical protein
MKVECLADTGKALFNRTLQLGYTRNTTYNTLKIGELYEVYSILLWNGNMHYLTVGKYEETEVNPFFDPAELFRVVDYRLPREWYCRWFGIEESERAIWGYREIVLDYPGHMERLMERYEEDLKIFYRRRQEMDESLRTLPPE